MKKLKLFFACLLMAVLSIGQVWAAEQTVSWNASSGALGSTISSVNGTAQGTISTGSFSWNYTRTLKVLKSGKSDYVGMSGSYIQLGSSNAGEDVEFRTSNIPGTIKSVTVLAGSKDTRHTGTITVGGTDYNAGAISAWASSAGSNWEGTGTSSGEIVISISCNGKQAPIYIASITVVYEEGSTQTCATPTFNPGAGSVVSGTAVTLSTNTEGATIYYTMGADPADPTTSSTQYNPENKPVISSATTIKAIAVKEGLDNSSVASASYTVVTPYTTIQDLFEAKTSTSTPVYITFGGWKISGVKGGQAFLTDGTKGLIIYQSSHGFVVGDALTGTAACNLIAYKGAVELTGLTSTSTGLTVTHGSMSDAVAKTIDELGAVNTSALVTISNVTYDGTNLSDGTNSIKPYNGLFSSMSFENGKKYNVTGVLNYYDALQIMPRSADDIVEVVDPGKVATPTFDPEGGEFSEAQNVTITCETEDATIYYTIDGTDPTTESTIYSTAIAVSETTTIKALAVKAEMTNSDIASATYTITGPQVTFNYVDYKGQGGPSGTGSSYTMADKPAVSIGNDKFFGNNSYAHFYAGGTITITPATGVTITRIVLTASAAGYNGYQSDGSITASTGSLSHDGAVVTWTGSADAAFTLENDKQIRWLTIVVTYEEADPSAPSLAVDPTVIDFGDVEQGESVTANTVAVNFANLTGEVTYSGLSSPFSATGTISATGDLISISADATVEVGEYEQTLTVTSAADSKSATVTVTMNVVAAASGDVYNKLTGSIEEGDYVIFYDGKALKNTIASNRFGYEEVTPVNNKINDPDASIIWSISQSGEHWTIYNEDVSKYAGATGSNNQGALLSEVGDKALWSIAGTGEFDITNKYQTENSKNAYLRNNGTYGFACYAEGTGGKLILYKAANSKAPAGIAYAATAVEKLVGAAKFTNELTNPNTLTVEYSSNNTDVATVDAESGEVTIVAAGVAEITASTLGDETHKAGSTKYTICVTAHAGTEADPYTVADAKIVIDALGTKEGVYAAGIICQVDAIDLTENFYATYWISANGLTDGQKLEAFHGKYLNNADFSAEDDIKVGDEVVIVGNLKKFGTSIYEFDGGNYLISLVRTKEAAGLAYAVASVNKNIGDEAFINELTNPHSVTVSYSSSAPSVASVDAATGEVTVNAMGEATITATFAGNGSYLPGSASYTISVNDPSITKVTFDATEDIAASGELELSKSNVTLEFSKGVMDNGTSYRLYKDAVMTLTCADGLIVRVELEGNDGSYPISNISGSGYSAGVWTGSAESVELEATEGQTRISKVNVYYQADSREAAGLAYAVTAIEKNEGDAKFTNELTNPNSVTVAYSSSNASVASVDAETGEVTIVAAGEAIITASFAGNATYKSANVSYTITVNAPAPTPSGTTYRKVTATENITDGEYLIVYEGDATHDAYAFNGSLDDVDQAKKGVAVTISEGVIAGTAAIDAAVFTINVTAGTLQSASGWYIGRTENSNGMEKNETTEYVNTFAISEGEAVITSSGGPTLRYNYASDQLRFRYYKSGQQPIQLYKKETAPEPTPDYTRNVTSGNYGTICLPNGGNISGAKLFDLEYYDGANTLYLLEVNGNAMEAGKPYIFLPSATTIEVFYTDDANEPAGSFHGLIGSYSQVEITKDAGNYILYQNQYWLVNSEAYVGANRAYIHMADVPDAPSQQQSARRRVAMTVNGANAPQGVDNIESGDQPVKKMINGTLYIIRGEKQYDATGRLVK